MNNTILNNFLSLAEGDSNISTTHISLFTALLSIYKKDTGYFNVSRSKLMRLSKLKSTATYHSCLKYLIEIGIIEYEPSFNPFKGSRMKINI